MNTLDGIALPNGLLWQDEFSWTHATQAKTYALDGSLIVEEAARQTGRAITLAGADDAGWADRNTVLSLYALAESPGDMALAWNGRQLTVRWDLTAAPIEAQPVMRAPQDDILYSITLRLFEVP